MIQTFLRLFTIARDNAPLPAYPQNPHSPGLFPSCPPTRILLFLIGSNFLHSDHSNWCTNQHSYSTGGLASLCHTSSANQQCPDSSHQITQSPVFSPWLNPSPDFLP